MLPVFHLTALGPFQRDQARLAFLFLNPTLELRTRDDTTCGLISAKQCTRDDPVFVREHLLRKLLGLGFRRKGFSLSGRCFRGRKSQLFWRFN
jgi:hypothetical protein